MEAVDVRGRFVWHELLTRDVPGAKKFYSKLVGWKALPWPLDPAYTVCHTDNGPVAGITKIASDLPAEVPSHWLLYIGTRDVDGTAEAAVRAGGSIVKAPNDLPGAGRHAVLKDPQGALFAIIDPENAGPEPATPSLGTFSWNELATSDHEAAFAFYSGLFGWDAISRMDMGPAGIYLIFGSKGVRRGGMYIKPPENPGPPSWLPYANLRNADESFQLALSSGGKATVPPMDIPEGGRIASVIDPAGAGFAIHSLPAAAAVPKAKPTAAPKVKAKATAKPKPKKAKAKVAKKKAAKLVAKRVMKKAKKKTAPLKAKRGKSKAKKSKTARRKK